MSASKPAARSAPVSVHRLEVRLKPDFADAQGASALALLHGLGVAPAREVRASQLYEIRGAVTATQVQQAAKELLCDPVTQELRVLASGAEALNGMSHWRVEVWLKPAVTDPVGDTVSAALREMGLPALESVRVGAAYRIAGKCGRHQLEKAVARCLANPVIHDVAVSEAHP